MLVGHYAPAYIIKAKYPQIPLWHLFLAVQVVDVFFFAFALVGLEILKITEGGHGPLGMELVRIPYTHSLVSNLIFAGLFIVWGIAVGRRRTGILLGVAIFSHWSLDLFVHLHDLPITLHADSYRAGFGWWIYPLFSMCFELVLLLVAYVLFRKTIAAGPARRFADVTCGLLVLISFGYTFGPTAPTVWAMAIGAEIFYLSMVLLAWRLDRRLPPPE